MYEYSRNIRHQQVTALPHCDTYPKLAWLPRGLWLLEVICLKVTYIGGRDGAIRETTCDQEV